MNEYLQILITMAIAMAIVAILGPLVIPMLRRLKAGQSIREDGPTWHASKAGTPTIGGIMILIGAVVAAIAGMRGVNADLMTLLLCFVLYGAIGFVDDYIKVVKRRNQGLKAKQKLVLQVLVAVLIAVYEWKMSEHGTSIYVPIWGHYLNLGILYIPFVAFVLVAMSNAVNLSDGLDGLAGGCTAIAAFFLALMGVGLPASAGVQNSVIFSAAVSGACLGFLIYNHHPAKVFMGDTGSLALGGALASAAVMMHIELILVLVGIIFVVEVLSDLIQVFCFKKFGIRVFKMAPIHHHFEKCDWKETKIVTVFWAVTLAGSLLGLLIL